MNPSPTIQQAVEILRAGGLVAFPTETVYGLGADATNAAAVAKIFSAKERPTHHPLIVHIADKAALSDWAHSLSSEVWQLAEAFWPGPLTLILPKSAHVLGSITGGQDTVGVRVPQHEIAQALLRQFGGGLVAPSANRFTRISPTNAQAVHEELQEKVDLVLDGGPCRVGVESTILDMSSDQPTLLRPGMITPEQLEQVLRRPVRQERQANAPRTAGMHHLHYAPVTPTRWIECERIAQLTQTSIEKQPMALLAWSKEAVSRCYPPHIQCIPMPNDAQSYAQRLYHSLRSLDQKGLSAILIERVPEDVNWLAIRDRLSKACR